MVFMTLVIGLLNVCLGYALAVHLGYGPGDLRTTWGALGLQAGPRGGTISKGPTVEELAEQLADASVDDLLDDEIDDEEEEEELEVEVYDESAGDGQEDMEAILDPNAPENWNLNEKYVETSILKLNIAMMKSGARATDIDTELRQCQGQSRVDTIRRCLEQLSDDCESYLSEQSELAEKFANRIGELGELKDLGGEIEIANLEQSAQVETTLNNLRHMDFESDLEAANLRLLMEIKNLRVARHKLRDNQDMAFATIARYENRLDKIEKRLFNDPLTNLYSRIGTEATLHQWWNQNRHTSRQMNAALLDLNQFGDINEHHGPLVGDRILNRVAQLIKEEVGKTDLIGRYAGQQFLVVTLDVGPRAATKMIEQIRQSLAKVTFRSGEEGIPLRLTAAITEVSPEDTAEGLCQRLEATLKAARKAGRNHSFFHDRKEPEPVESPDFHVEERDIEI